MLINRRAVLQGITAATVAGTFTSASSGKSLRQAADKKGRVSMYGTDTVFELRQYTLFGGKRDALIDLFEDRFIEPQDELGARVVATFRDLDDPDRFVWFRGFRDMPNRKRALETFYGGPVWKANRTVANATMVDSDNVLLLKPAAIARQPLNARQSGEKRDRSAVYGARIFDLGAVDPRKFADAFASAIEPLLIEFGADPVAAFVTEPAANNFPMLPIRPESVFVWVARFNTAADEQAFHDHWAKATGWRDAISADLLPALFRKPERIRLAPTRRSPIA